MVEPHVALITNIGPAHLETMDTIENIANAKFELLENLDKDSLRILNLDDPILKARFDSEPQPKMGYAVRADAEIKPTVFSANSLGRLIFNYADQEIHLSIPGLHNLYNALAACAVAKAFEVDPADIKAALEKYIGKNSRMQIHSLGDITVIDDSYNANPTSMGYALKALYDMGGEGRKIAVLGDMKELGKDEVNLHHQVGQVVAELELDKLITVGKLGMQIAAQANADGFDPAKTETFMNVENAIEWMLANLKPGDHILIKASRAMKFEKILTALLENFKEEG
jgi:UDP-N-acetylmuramoyl-tripeptide--D-alanyl-D-alanine ligase